MSRLFYHVMQDNSGNLLFDVSGTMRYAGTGTLATIYGDEGLTVILANPMVNHPSFGSFKCFLAPGANYDFYMAKAGYTFETLTGVQGLGTMALQNSNAVTITGGSAAFSGTLQVADTTIMGGDVAFGVLFAPTAQARVHMEYPKAARSALSFRPTDNDTGAAGAVLFFNLNTNVVGAISTNATTTTYATTSDARLKHDVETLTGELDAIRTLRPVRFKWNADDSPGVGFLANEVAAHVQGVITGEADAVNPDGTIQPQMIDMSRLVPFLVGALQTLAARVAVLEDALGA